MSTVQESAAEQFDLLNIINNTIKVVSRLHFTFWTRVCCGEIPGLDSRKPGSSSVTVSGTAFPLMTEKSFHYGRRGDLFFSSKHGRFVLAAVSSGAELCSLISL